MHRKVFLAALGVLSAGIAPALARVDGLPRYLAAAGCGLRAGDASRWHADRRLDEAAALWARGAALHDAIDRSGYTAAAVSGIHLENFNADNANGQRPSASACRALRDDSLRDFGSYQRGEDAWIMLAAPIELPVAGDESRIDAHALELVNRARAEPRRCGSREMPAAPPLRSSAQLGQAADEHARDMAQHHYFEHEDRSGRAPADRVRATGYAEWRVGENIAYGALSTSDAVAGWLKSAGHCENLMDPKFQEMGIAFAREQGARGEVYWVQVLATPKHRFAPPSPNH
ncbi:MAG: CAP domain-containing protein [Steroidobacteraceae bacterium]